jgi:hypothetical protein
LFTAEEGEARFGPDPEEFRLSQSALARKDRREAAVAAAARADAARFRQEELGGVVDERKPKKHKKGGEGAAEMEKKRESTTTSRAALQPDGNGAGTEGAPAVPGKRNKKVKGKCPVESCGAARSYAEAVAWGDQGLALHGRIAAAIEDMVCARAAARLCLLFFRCAVFL